MYEDASLSGVMYKSPVSPPSHSKIKITFHSTAPYLRLNTMYDLPASTSKLLQDSAREYDTRSVKNKKEICPILASR